MIDPPDSLDPVGGERAALAAALPRYELGEELGRGGWGVVYRGEHRELARAVAVKQLAPTVGVDTDARARFVSEARLVAGLDHPHIVPVYDFVQHDGICAIVMEMATGGSVRDRLDPGLRADESVAVGLAVATGLDHAHRRGLLHRDIKPDNVLFTSGTVRITDFGIAKVIGADTTARTATGAIIGTPAYMAPEQVTGDQLSPATDLYALGVMLYRLLAGELPYPPAPDAVAQLFQHVHEPARPLQTVRPEIDDGVAAVVDRALSKDPTDRHQSGEELAVELASATRRWLGEGWLARSGLAVMGSTAVAAAAERGGAGVGGGDVSAGPASAHHAGPPGATAAGSPGRSPATAATSGPPPRPPAHAPAERAAALPLHRRPLVLGLAGLVVVALVVGVIINAVGGGDNATSADPDDGPAGVAGGDEEVPVTEAELARFRTACGTGGVSERRCGCVADRAGVDLDPDDFRRGLELIEGDGQALTPELEAVFEACVEAGF